MKKKQLLITNFEIMILLFLQVAFKNHSEGGPKKKNVKGGRKKGIMASLIENGTKLKQGW